VDEDRIQQKHSHIQREDAVSGPNVFEVNTHVFVVRVWLEDAGFEDQTPLWRGHVTHALSGKRRYFQDMHTVLEFITSYLIVN
jgi:hypothetical protein